MKKYKNLRNKLSGKVLTHQYTKKGASVFCSRSAKIKYAFIEQHAEIYKANELCNTLQVSESGYYRWRSNKLSFKERRDNYLIQMIKQIHSSVKGRYGSLRIYQVLKEQGEPVSRKRVNRLMRENNIYAKTKHKFKTTTYSKRNNTVAPNLLEQNFKTSSPN